MPPSSPATPRPFSFSPGAASAPTSPSPLRRGASPRSRAGSPANPVTLASFGAPALGAASPSPDSTGRGAGTTNEPPPVPTGSGALLPRHKEITYHRSLRGLLLDHRKWREQWEEMLTVDGLKAVSAYSQADEEAVRLVGSIQQSRRAGDPALLHAKEHHLATALGDRETGLDTMAEVLRTLHSFVDRLRKLDARARQLLLDASAQQGFEFALRDGMWGSWTMDAFVRTMASLTRQYAISTADLQSALDQLTPHRLHVATPPAKTLSTAAALSSAGSDSYTSPDASTQASGFALPSPEAGEKQRKRLNEAWAMLPFLVKTGPTSERFFENICEVEVGQWDQ